MVEASSVRLQRPLTRGSGLKSEPKRNAGVTSATGSKRLTPPFEQMFDQVEFLARASLIVAGYRRHLRAEWRRKREKRSKASGKKAVQKEEKRIIKLVRRAENGDGEALCEIRKIVDVEPADWAEWATSPIRLNKLWLRWQQQRT